LSVRPSVTSDKVHVHPISKYSSIFEHILENIHRIYPLRPIPNKQNRSSVRPSRPSMTSLPPNTSDKTTLHIDIEVPKLVSLLHYLACFQKGVSTLSVGSEVALQQKEGFIRTGIVFSLNDFMTF
jgi:hypothetical protein